MPNPHKRNLLEWLRQYGALSPVPPPLADQLVPTVVVDDVTNLRQPIHGPVWGVRTNMAGAVGEHSGLIIIGKAGGIWLREINVGATTDLRVMFRQTDLIQNPVQIPSSGRFVSLPELGRVESTSETWMGRVLTAEIDANEDMKITVSATTKVWIPGGTGIYVPPGNFLYIVLGAAGAAADFSALVEEVPVT